VDSGGLVHISLDFETRSEADLKKVGAYEYARHPSTELLCMGYRWKGEFGPNGGKPVHFWHPGFTDLAHLQKAKLIDRTSRDLPARPRPDRLLQAIQNGAIVEAHNVWFERCIWHFVCVGKLGWSPLIVENLRCSAAKAASFSLRRKLQHACQDLQLPVQKDMAGNRVMLKLSKPRKPTKRDPDSPWHQARAELIKTFAYNVDDVRAEECLSESLRDLPPTELQLFQLDQRMNWRGIHIDREFVDAALAIGAIAEDRGNAELDDITYGCVTKATQKIPFLNWMEGEGVKVPVKFNKKGERKRTTEGEALQKMLDADDEWTTYGKRLANPPARTRAQYDVFLAKAMMDFSDNSALPTFDMWRRYVPEPPEGQCLPETVRRAIEVWMSVNQTSTKKYNAFSLRSTSADDRVRETLLYYAASTGRWGGRGVQPQNLSRNYPKNALEIIGDIKRRDFDLLTFLYDGDNIQSLLKGVMRGVITAPSGYDLIASDASSIEARGVFWVSGHEEGLEVFRKIDSGAFGNKDIYCWMAEKIFGYDVIKEMEERQAGKVGVLGCGYQMGDKKLVDYADSMNVALTAAQAKQTVQGYRSTNWPVVDFWKASNDAAIQAVDHPGTTVEQNEYIRWGVRGRFLHCRLPSGRLLSYLDPTVEWGLTPWGQEVRKLKFMGTNTYTRQWERTDTYGGKLTENIVQALCRDIMAEGMLRVEEAGYPLVLTVHDEIVSEVLKGFGSLEEYNEILAQPPAWAPDFPIVWEGWRGERYRK
jgi:DNA polymerase